MPSLPLRETVLRTLRENVLLCAGDRVLVAVSGGPDSVCLLHLLHELAPALSISLHVAHLDHCLRSESTQEAAFVGDLCARWKIPLTVKTVDAAGEARQRRMGIEETARMLRRAFLLATANEADCRVVALGHHRGDQAETVLHRLLRGSGTSGLVGMRPQDGPIVRPLLDVDRMQILAYLEQHQVPWVEDKSNLDTAFTRNRLRHQVLPLLAGFNPRIEEHLARLGHRLGMEEDYWLQQAIAALTSLARFDGEDLFLDCRRLRELHPALRARVLREALRQVRGDLQRIEAVHLQQIDRLLYHRHPQGEEHLPGVWVGRRYERLWLRRIAPTEPPPVMVEISGPGTFLLPGGTLHVTYEATARGEDPLTVEFDPALEFPLRVRTFRPGDRFRPDGMGGHKKVKNFFIDAKVDREARQRILIVEEKEILWLVGMRRCADRRAGSGAVLRLCFQPGHGDNFDC